MTADLSVVSLFAGVGGLDLAAERAGMQTRLACELDPRCREVLGRRFPDAVIHDDVRTLTADDLRAAGAVPERTLFTAGWPCQGNSVAGRRAGMDDARSGLWSEVWRLLAEFRPAWFLGENVPGLLSVNGGWDYATVVGDLAELGYGFAWRVLDAQYFGVPQRRRRVVIVGHLGDTGAAPVEVLLEPESSGRDHPKSGTPGQGIAATLTAGVAASRGVSRPGRRQEDDVNLVTHALTAEGADASEDGTGRGTPLVVTALDTQQGGPDDNSAQGGHLIAFAFGSHSGTAEGDQTNRSHASGGPVGLGVSEELAYSLRAERTQSVAVAFAENQRGEVLTSPVAAQLSTGGGKPGQGYPAALTDNAVRRLTPLECERLQGFPDGWTEPGSDAQRYKQMGNSVAVPVFTWVMRRLAAVDARARKRAA